MYVGRYTVIMLFGKHKEGGWPTLNAVIMVYLLPSLGTPDMQNTCLSCSNNL